MNIIAVSGGSGSGKSTTLKSLESMGYGVIHIKTARSVLTDWHLTLQEVYADVELTMKFQDELIERKFYTPRIGSNRWAITTRGRSTSQVAIPVP